MEKPLTHNLIKAIFLDIDGTMVSFKTHHVPDGTKRALAEARRRGVKIFVATGRHRSDITNLDGMEFDGYVSLNGAYCWIGRQTVYSKAIPKRDVAAFVRYCNHERMIPCFFVEKDRVVANMVDDAMRDMLKIVQFDPRPIVPMHELLRKDIFQLTAFFPQQEEAGIMRNLPGCTVTRWYPTFADIIALGVDKGVGLKVMGSYLGVRSEEMMAFGDGGNDISMIRYAGIGIAMGNAGEDVKAAADYVTNSVDDDGIGEALRHFGVIV